MDAGVGGLRLSPIKESPGLGGDGDWVFDFNPTSTCKAAFSKPYLVYLNLE